VVGQVGGGVGNGVVSTHGPVAGNCPEGSGKGAHCMSQSEGHRIVVMPALRQRVLPRRCREKVVVGGSSSCSQRVQQHPAAAVVAKFVKP